MLYFVSSLESGSMDNDFDLARRFQHVSVQLFHQTDNSLNPIMIYPSILQTGLLLTSDSFSNSLTKTWQVETFRLRVELIEYASIHILFCPMIPNDSIDEVYGKSICPHYQDARSSWKSNSLKSCYFGITSCRSHFKWWWDWYIIHWAPPLWHYKHIEYKA